MQIARINRPFVPAILVKVPPNDVIRIVIARRVHFPDGSPVSSQTAIEKPRFLYTITFLYHFAAVTGKTDRRDREQNNEEVNKNTHTYIRIYKSS